MSIKQKLLSVLDICIADIKEETLLNILVDLYKQRGDRIIELEGENAKERQDLKCVRESIRIEMDRAKRDPLYFNNAKQYVFKNDQHKTVIVIYADAGKLNVHERKGGYSIAMREAPDEI